MDLNIIIKYLPTIIFNFLNYLFKKYILKNLSITFFLGHNFNDFKVGKINNIRFNSSLSYFDLYNPKKIINNKPMIVFCHGGYFVNDDEESDNVKYLAQKFNNLGYRFVSLNYTKQKMPENISKNNLGKYESSDIFENIDPIKAIFDGYKDLIDLLYFLVNSKVDEVILIGYSAGAILVLLNLLNTYYFGIDNSSNIKIVKMIVSLAGTLSGNSIVGLPSNFSNISFTGLIQNFQIPLLLWHGDEDNVISLDGVLELQDIYNKNNYSNYLKVDILKGVDHDCIINIKNKESLSIAESVDHFYSSLNR